MASSYTPEQVDRFLSLIQLPDRYHPRKDPPRDIAFLIVLHTHTLSTVPYENLLLHYSQSKRISLDLQVLYQKIVLDGRGRGGYCMENALFYLHMLRGLGFRAYATGVRIRLRADGVPSGDYVGLRHIVIIVTLEDNTTWMIDVGFGGDGASKPMPLVEGQITHNMGTQEIRLVRDFLPEQSERQDPTRMSWIYQYRNGPEKPWNSNYGFSEVEFMHDDFDVISLYTSTHPSSFQTFMMVIVKFLRRANADVPGEEEIYGKRMLVNGTVKENLSGKTVVVQECLSEQERIGALKKWFGIALTDEEREGIRGHVTELNHELW